MALRQDFVPAIAAGGQKEVRERRKEEVKEERGKEHKGGGRKKGAEGRRGRKEKKEREEEEAGKKEPDPWIALERIRDQCLIPDHLDHNLSSTLQLPVAS